MALLRLYLMIFVYFILFSPIDHFHCTWNQHSHFQEFWRFQWPVLWHAATNTGTEKTQGAVYWCWEQEEEDTSQEGQELVFLLKKAQQGSISLQISVGIRSGKLRTHPDRVEQNKMFIMDSGFNCLRVSQETNDYWKGWGARTLSAALSLQSETQYWTGSDH